MDRISKLPTGIIEAILCLLPIQEAARTSILSREWRYLWITIPKLAFIENTFQVSTDRAELSVLEQTFDKPSRRKRMNERCEFFYAIYQVLLMHQGPIHEFTLSMRADGSCVEIDHILLHLSKNNTVKKLKLDLDGRESYRLPLSFFSLHQLTELYLKGCFLDHQPSSSGFRSLTTLHLPKIWTHEEAFLHFLSGCPSLKKVTFNRDCGIATSQDSSIADLIGCLPNVEYLSLWFYIVVLNFKNMCFNPLPKVLPTALVHLKYLCMQSLCFYHKDSLPFLALLIKSSPNLKKLKLELLDMDVLDENEMDSFTLEDYSNIMLEHLDELEILNFSNNENESVFLKLFFAKSPVLNNVSILLWDEFDEDKKLEVKEFILSLPCASSAAKVIVSW